MAQGVLSVTVGGEVALKLIVGAKGDKIATLTAKVKKLKKAPSSDQLLKLARDLGFGMPESLILISKSAIGFEGDCSSWVPGRCRETFGDPEWNPCSDDGSVTFLDVVEFDA